MSLLPLALKSWELTVVSAKRPILPEVNSVNHSAPSGPVVMPSGGLRGVGIGNSVITPAVVMRPILPGTDSLAKPSVYHSARSGRDKLGDARGRRDLEFGNHSCGGECGRLCRC